MRLSEILTKAQVLSGVGVFEGNAVDMNMASTCASILRETINDINNDPRVTLLQKELDYQAYSEEPGRPPGCPMGLECCHKSEICPPSCRMWVNAVPPDFRPETLFPGVHGFPFPVARAYPLPRDCRRVLKAIGQGIELRKTDFGEIVRARSLALGPISMFAVNGSAIELARPSPIVIVYVREFAEFMPQDEVDIPNLALPYVINLAAYNIALSFNEGAAARCKIMAEKSYDSLLGNLRVNAGSKHINPMEAFARFEDGWGGGRAWL